MAFDSRARLLSLAGRAGAHDRVGRRGRPRQRMIPQRPAAAAASTRTASRARAPSPLAHRRRRRRSPGAVASGSKPSTRNPDARGDHARNATSAAAHQRRTASVSGGWCRIDHWCCTTANGATACARTSRSRAWLDNPMWRTLPIATSSAMVPTDSSTGTDGSGSWSWRTSTRSVPNRTRLSSRSARMAAGRPSSAQEPSARRTVPHLVRMVTSSRRPRRLGRRAPRPGPSRRRGRCRPT